MCNLLTVTQSARHPLISSLLDCRAFTMLETRSESNFHVDLQQLKVQSARWLVLSIKSSKLLFGPIREALNAKTSTRLSWQTKLKCWKLSVFTIRTTLEILETQHKDSWLKCSKDQRQYPWNKYIQPAKSQLLQEDLWEESCRKIVSLNPKPHTHFIWPFSIHWHQTTTFKWNSQPVGFFTTASVQPSPV